MKFIIMSSPGPENNFVDELITSKLFPSLIVTDSPFYCGNVNFFKSILIKGLLILRYLTIRSEIKKKYQAYFLAKKYSIPIWPSQKVNNDQFAELIKELGIDYAFIFTFDIISEIVFKAPKLGCINFHPSLLPLNRGGSPLNWTILNNNLKTGITFHFISKDIDAGPIIEQYEIPLSGYETAKILNQYLFSIGAILFVRLILRLKLNYKYSLSINDIRNGTYEPRFEKGNTIISDKNTYQEISLIIRASRFLNLYATYKYSGKEYMILNCIELTDSGLSTNEYPHLDEDNNIHIKSTDNKLVLLVTRYAPAREMCRQTFQNLKARANLP